MLTPDPNPANGEANAPPRAVMWTVSQIAARDGVSKPVVSVRVKRFVEQHGLTVERDGQGHVRAVNVAEYDHYRRRYDDPSKAQAPPPASAPAPQFSTPGQDASGKDARPGESYDEAQRQRAWLDAEKRRIELDELKGHLISTAGVANGFDRAANRIRTVIENLEERADDLAAVVAREGSHGLRVALKRLSVTLLADMASGLRAEAETLRAAAPTEAAADNAA